METQTLEKPTFDTQDEFKRKPIAENIIRLLTSDIDLSPMVIDGGWGTGKTEFCQKLIRLMQQQHPDYQPVYIDAFRSDHSGEPLLALLAEIIKACTPEDTGEQPSEQRKNITRKVAKAAGFVMKTVAKAAVGHVLKQNTDDLAEGLQQIINDGQDADSLAETVTRCCCHNRQLHHRCNRRSLVERANRSRKKSGNAQSLPERIGSRQTDYPVYRRT